MIYYLIRNHWVLNTSPYETLPHLTVNMHVSPICLHTVFWSNQLQIKQCWFYRNIPMQCNERSTVFTQCKTSANLHSFIHQNATKCIINNSTVILERCRLVNNSSLPGAIQAAHNNPDSKVHGANMGPIWGRQDPGGPHELCYLRNSQASVLIYLLRFDYRSAFNIHWTRAKIKQDIKIARNYV